MKKLKLLLITVITFMALTACTSGLKQGLTLRSDGTGADEYESDYDVLDSGPAYGGTLNLFSTEPDTFNPLLTKNSYVAEFLGFVYEGLTKLNENQQAVPALSDNWSVSEDGLIWSFHIRDGVKWHDGEPLTAYDVEFTIQTLLNPRVDSVYRSLLANVKTCAAVDSANIRIALEKPNSFLPEMMNFPILPAHQFSQAGLAGSTEGFTPIGTGPYRFVSYEKSKNVILKSNKEWWYLDFINGAPEKSVSGDDVPDENIKEAGNYDTTDSEESISDETGPRGMYIETIQVKIFNNSDELARAFKNGEVDVAVVSADDSVKYSGRTDVTVKKITSRNYEFLAFNMRNPVFADPSARKAIYIAIDRDELINEILPGNAEVAELPVLPSCWLLQPYENAAVSAQTPEDVLSAGGWKHGNRGYYKVIGGVRRYLEVELLVNRNNATRVKAAEKICSQLNGAGIPAKVKQSDWNEMVKLIGSAKYDMAFLGCRIPQIPDISYLYADEYLLSGMGYDSERAYNVSGYDNAELKAKITELFGENDPVRKKAIFYDITKQALDDVPYIGLYFLRDAVIYGENLKGPLKPDTWNKFNDFVYWYKPSIQ